MIETMTFGVEIETTIPTGSILVGTYRGGMPAEGLPTGWVAKEDGSIRASRGRRGCEFVSPVLTGASGVRSLMEAVRAINAVGARVNPSCGFHVHIGFPRVNNRPVMDRLMTLAANFEKAIYASTGTKSRENNHYCGGVARYGTVGSAIARAGMDRYHLLNLTNIMGTGHGFDTVEFRAFAGTLNITKILGYVRMSLGLVERAMSAKRPTNWTAKTPVASSPIARRGEGQTALTRLYYQLGWTHGRTAYTYGNIGAESAPSLKACKKALMKMARQYDALP